MKKKTFFSKEYLIPKSLRSIPNYVAAYRLLERVTHGCCQWLGTSDTLPTSTQDSFCRSLLCRKLELTSSAKEGQPNYKASSIAIYVSLPLTDTLSISDLHVRVVVSSSEPQKMDSLWNKLLSTTTIGGKGCNLYLTQDIKRHAKELTT